MRSPVPFSLAAARATSRPAVGFRGCQGLSARQLAVEGRMLGEVVDEHVASPAGETGPTDVLGGELLGEALVKARERLEALEHLPVARGVRAPALDDVTPVPAVLADRLDELRALGQRLAERRPQLVGLGSGEFVALAAQRERDPTAAGGQFGTVALGFAVAVDSLCGIAVAVALGRCDALGRRISTFGREFLDQPPTGDLLYPRNRGCDSTLQAIVAVAR